MLQALENYRRKLSLLGMHITGSNEFALAYHKGDEDTSTLCINTPSDEIVSIDVNKDLRLLDRPIIIITDNFVITQTFSDVKVYGYSNNPLFTKIRLGLADPFTVFIGDINKVLENRIGKHLLLKDKSGISVVHKSGLILKFKYTLDNLEIRTKADKVGGLKFEIGPLDIESEQMLYGTDTGNYSVVGYSVANVYYEDGKERILYPLFTLGDTLEDIKYAKGDDDVVMNCAWKALSSLGYNTNEIEWYIGNLLKRLRVQTMNIMTVACEHAELPNESKTELLFNIDNEDWKECID